MTNSLDNSVALVSQNSKFAMFAMYSSIALNVALVVFVGGSLEPMWALLNCLQLISYLPLMTSYFPEHVQIMFNLLGFANMDIQIFSDLFIKFLKLDKIDQQAYNRRFQDNQLPTTLFLYTCASLLLSLILTVASFILTLVMYVFMRCEKLNLKLKNILSSYFFRGPVRIFVESFLDLSFGTTLNLMMFKASNSTEIASYVLSAVIFASLIILG